MRAVRVAQVGGPEAMRVEEVPDPQPGESQARVRVAAAGVNFIDVYFRTGAYPKDTPFTIGLEAAGTVDAVGPGVTDVSEGDRVAFAQVPGAYAESVVVPAHRLVQVPDGVELETAAAVMLQGMTAHYLAASTFPLDAESTALLHAGAGGVGLLLTQIAKLRGATVYTTVGSEEKAELSRRAGADEAIVYTDADFAEEVRRLAPDGVDVVYESVGAATFDRSLECLRRRGTLVLFGQSSGRVDPVDPQRLNAAGSLYLTRPNLGDHVVDRDELRWRSSELFEWIGDGRLEVRIGETHPLAEAATAHERLESRQTTGKVLLIP